MSDHGPPWRATTQTRMQAIRIIHEEHRSLAAVLHGLAFLVRQIRERGAEPDFAVLGAMIHYIDAFPERFHHPKEDRYLFRRVRRRCPEAAPLLDRLQSEHRAGARKIRTLEQALAHYQYGGSAEFPAFAAAAESYIAFHRAHMQLEEQELLPLARRCLVEEDWKAIDAAFLGNADPMVGASARAQFQSLFARIVALAPAPIGQGPALPSRAVQPAEPAGRAPRHH